MRPARAVARHAVTLDHDADIEGFRRAARRLLRGGVHPVDITWRVATHAEGDLLAAIDEGGGEGVDQGVDQGIDGGVACAPTPTVPAFFVPLTEKVALHSDPDRFGLLYRLLWRLQHEPGLRHDLLDNDRRQAERMAQAVRREMHKMTAFVRFRPVQATADGDAGSWHVAWFEPAHHVVQATAPFFARRFATMRWALLTPECSARWDGHTLAFGAGARREDAPAADAGERLWLTYYAHIFNPARLKLAMMEKEMPRRYWPNLPESVLIAPLAAEAASRTARMVEQPATEPAHRRPGASLALVQAEPPDTLLATRDSLPALRSAVARCRECPLGALATHGVAGEGPDHAPLMLVGEQPGDLEDLRGRPFVGPAGQLLDRAFATLGWPREALYLTNAVKHFKYELRGQRRIHKTAAQREAAACLHWLDEEIALVRPRALVALGATALRALLGPGASITRDHGQWQTRPDGLPVLPVLHPAALLRMEADQRAEAHDRWIAALRSATPHVRG